MRRHWYVTLSGTLRWEASLWSCVGHRVVSVVWRREVLWRRREQKCMKWCNLNIRDTPSVLLHSETGIQWVRFWRASPPRSVLVLKAVPSIFPETLNMKTWNKIISFERHIQSRSNQARSDWNLHRILVKCFNFKYQISYTLALFNVIHCAVKVLTAWVTPTFLLLVVPADPFQSQQAKLTLFHLDNHAQS